jgi:hypothetical protein
MTLNIIQSERIKIKDPKQENRKIQENRRRSKSTQAHANPHGAVTLSPFHPVFLEFPVFLLKDRAD